MTCVVCVERSRKSELEYILVLVLGINFSEMSSKMHCKNMPFHHFFESTETKGMKNLVILVYLKPAKNLHIICHKVFKKIELFCYTRYLTLLALSREIKELTRYILMQK